MIIIMKYITRQMVSTFLNTEFINHYCSKSRIDLSSSAWSIVATSCFIAPFRFVNVQGLWVVDVGIVEIVGSNWSVFKVMYRVGVGEKHSFLQNCGQNLCISCELYEMIVSVMSCLLQMTNSQKLTPVMQKYGCSTAAWQSKLSIPYDIQFIN